MSVTVDSGLRYLSTGVICWSASFLAFLPLCEEAAPLCRGVFPTFALDSRVSASLRPCEPGNRLASEDLASGLTWMKLMRR